MQINSISGNNQNFGRLVYPKDVKKLIVTAVADKTREDYSRMVTLIGRTFFDSESRNIDKFINNLTRAKDAYSKKNDAILERFAQAVNIAAESKHRFPRLILKNYNKKNKLVAVVDNAEQKTSTFTYTKNGNIFTFLQNINDAVLGKIKS